MIANFIPLLVWALLFLPCANLADFLDSKAKGSPVLNSGTTSDFTAGYYLAGILFWFVFAVILTTNPNLK